MRIGIGGQLLQGRRTGVEIHIARLMRNLPRYDGENEYVYYVNPEAADLYGISPGGGARTRSACPFRNRLLRIVWEQTSLPRLIAGDGLDLFHSPGYTLPLSCPVPAVVTIHDTMAFSAPELCGVATRIHHRILLSSSARRADRIITCSQHSKNDIIEHLGVDADSIEVVYNGIDEAFAPATDDAVVRDATRRYGLTNPFFLFAGRVERKKNVPAILEAFAALRDAGMTKHDLVLTGPPGPDASGIAGKAAGLGISARVRTLGFVPTEDLAMLYNAADILLFPSLYEGFGMPPIEAMACGTPVVASDGSSLPEVTGGAALLVDPRDPRAIADAALEILTDSALREVLISKGLERAGEFTSERNIRRTVEVYRQVTDAR